MATKGLDVVEYLVPLIQELKDFDKEHNSSTKTKYVVPDPELVFSFVNENWQFPWRHLDKDVDKLYSDCNGKTASLEFIFGMIFMLFQTCLFHSIEDLTGKLLDKDWIVYVDPETINDDTTVNNNVDQAEDESTLEIDWSKTNLTVENNNQLSLEQNFVNFDDSDIEMTDAY